MSPVVLAVVVLAGWTLTPASARTIKGDNGQDLLIGGPKRDEIIGKGSSDILFGLSGRDVLRGGDGGDFLVAGPSKDRLRGGAGGDTLIDDDGPVGPKDRTEKLIGGPDNDRHFAADGGRTLVRCGEGTDVAVLDPDDRTDGKCETIITTSTVSAELGLNVVYGTDVDDVLSGTTGRDLLIGRLGDDSLAGGNENDALLGGPGVDTLDGEGGLDQLVDDDGTPGDTLNGGDESDWISSLDGAADTITCGDGSDFVYADDIDTIAPDCENVTTTATV